MPRPTTSSAMRSSPERRAAVDAKGKSEPLPAWRLVGVRPDVPAFARPISDAVRRSRSRARRAPSPPSPPRRARDECRLATIVGPPGIGKSRLAREVVGSIETEARVVVGRCVAYGDGVTYLPLGEIVRDVAGPEPEPARRAPGERRAGDVAQR